MFQIYNHQISLITHSTEILRQEGVYPYDYVSSISKFKETKLPSKEEFYSKLNNENISDKDYQHAIIMFGTHLRATPCKYRPKCGKAQKIKIALLLHTDRL